MLSYGVLVHLFKLFLLLLSLKVTMQEFFLLVLNVSLLLFNHPRELLRFVHKWFVSFSFVQRFLSFLVLSLRDLIFQLFLVVVLHYFTSYSLFLFHLLQYLLALNRVSVGLPLFGFLLDKRLVLVFLENLMWAIIYFSSSYL